jgi:hypothetical protein
MITQRSGHVSTLAKDMEQESVRSNVLTTLAASLPVSFLIHNHESAGGMNL